MNILVLTKNAFAAKYSLTDLFDAPFEMLKRVWESGEDFTTYYGCSKEFHYAKILRENGFTTIEVTAEMDNLFGSDNQLVFDALSEEFGYEDVELSDAQVEEVLRRASEHELSDYAFKSVFTKDLHSFEDFIGKIEELENAAESSLNEQFMTLRGIVREVYEEGEDKRVRTFGDVSVAFSTQEDAESFDNYLDSTITIMYKGRAIDSFKPRDGFDAMKFFGIEEQ